MPIRPLADGDDLRLNEVFADAPTPAAHMARSLFRPSADAPLLRSVLAEVVPGVPVGAAAIAESPLHPFRAWVNVEVAAEERGHGLGRELFERSPPRLRALHWRASICALASRRAVTGRSSPRHSGSLL